MSGRPIPTRDLIPIAAIAMIVAVLALLDAPAYIVIALAVAALAWAVEVVVRHYLRKKKEH